MVSNHAPPAGYFGGSALSEANAAAVLTRMSAQLNEQVANKTLPDVGADVPANRACYNLPISPLSFDFAIWLIDAEMSRRIAGAPAPLRVAFWHGHDGKTGGLEDDHRRQMFSHVVKPLLALVGAVEDPTAIDGHYKQFFSSRDIVKRHMEGHEVPKFKAPADKLKAMAARHNREPVTITLREYTQFAERNSNTEAWLKFADWLKDRGEHVVIVRDTVRALEPLDGYETCPEASLDLHWRIALYETAKMNFFVSNGPACLGHFSDFPWLMFIKPEDDSHGYEPNTPKFWREQVGIEMGVGQFPWCRADQRIVWQPEDFANMVEAWKEWEQQDRRQAAA
jgi:hypothetical protein